MTFYAKLLSNIQSLPHDFIVAVPTRQTVSVSHHGQLITKSDFVLKHFLLVPIQASVSKLCLGLNCIVIFIPTTCYIQAPSMNKHMVLGNVKGSLYLPRQPC